MSTSSIGRLTLAGALTLSMTAAVTSHGRVAITVTPTSYDFGKEIMGKTLNNPEAIFRVQLSPGATAQDVVYVDVVDPTQEDFKVDMGQAWRPAARGGSNLPSFACGAGSMSAAASSAPTLLSANSVPSGVGTCYLRVWFQPSTPGLKHGTINLWEQNGTHTKIDLTGIGEVGCVYTVVQGCNYAPMYSGSFDWTHTITSANSSYAEDVNVGVVNGVATCNVTAKQVDNGRAQTGTVVGGKGLIAVEFLGDSIDSTQKIAGVVYRIIVACPSPAWPRTPDSDATPSRPANLDDFSQETYRQLTKAVGDDLVGGSSQAAPETDPVNRVGGRLALHWSLKRS